MAVAFSFAKSNGIICDLGYFSLSGVYLRLVIERTWRTKLRVSCVLASAAWLLSVIVWDTSRSFRWNVLYSSQGASVNPIPLDLSGLFVSQSC